ncbi:MAG TPA: hypothetical protein PK306_05195 [Aquabacterium sp.]|nr:hypothetical protein [Aquabacterium sp.]HQC95083.1 hypothetical protein [Aquabacterium sp.]
MALHSPHWHRVATLRPRLSPTVRLRRQRLRGETWYLLADEASGQSCRLNAGAYALAGRLDGQRSVAALWQTLQAGDGDPPTQDETVDLLARLRESGLVAFDRPADFGLLLPHLDATAPARPRPGLLAWRLPLANPSALLDRLRRPSRALFTPACLVLWALAVLLGLLLAAQHLPALQAGTARLLASPGYLGLGLLLYPAIKALHELAHGLAVRHFGGQVREAGVTLMLGLPVPYVDASAASAFERRGARIAVSAAGIVAELAIAALALPLWLLCPDGLLRDAALATLLITGASTVLFNANPLQRLDGYYLLCDALALPNLAPRSRAWWLQALQQRLLRLPDDEPMPVARGERGWLVAYAPLAWVWQLGVVALAVLWLGQWSAALGLAAAVLLGWQGLLQPPWRLWGQLRRSAQTAPAGARRLQRLGLGVGAVLLAVLLVPLPRHTVALGVVWPGEAAQLRADTEGLVQTLAREDGATVAVGDLVLTLDNPRLLAERQRQAARIAALDSELVQAMGDDGARRGDLGAERAAAQAALDRLDERIAGLQVRAGAAGRLALPEAADLPGRYQRQGSLVGQVLTGDRMTVRVALPEDQAGSLQAQHHGLRVRLAAAGAGDQPATLVRDSVGAVSRLPSAALGQAQGGQIATDPADSEGLRTLQPVVLLDVQLDAGPDAGPDDGPGAAAAAPRLGQRAWVRFDQGWQPLAGQLAQGLLRRVQRHFNPQA